MKKTLALLFLAALFLFPSCGTVTQSVLFYQNGLETVSATMETETGERFGILLSFSGNFRKLTVTEPESIAGVSFESDGTERFFSLGDVRREAPAEATGVFEAVLDAFTLPESGISEMGKDADGNTFIRVAGKDTSYVIFPDSDGVPSKIGIYGKRKITLDALKLGFGSGSVTDG